MARLAEGYFLLLKAVIGLLLAGMVVLVFGNVVMRYVFNSGIAISDELARWFFVWLVFLGAIVGLREHAHLGVDTLLLTLGQTGRRICFILSHVLMIICAMLLLKGSWSQTLINWKVVAPASGLSVGLFYGVGVVFGASALVILTHELWLVLSGKASDADLITVRESEER
ncbi:MAG: TRAP transporter small permease [Bosea sp. (in: a-proteobacteria)]